MKANGDWNDYGQHINPLFGDLDDDWPLYWQVFACGHVGHDPRDPDNSVLVRAITRKCDECRNP